MRKLLALLLSLACVPYAFGSASSAAKNAPYSSRCFGAYPKAPVPDISVDDGDPFNINLYNFFGNSDPTVTNDPVCTNPLPTWSVTNGVPGGAVDLSNPKLPTYHGIATGSAASDTGTVHVDNAVSTEVTDTFDWTVNVPQTAATPIPLDGHAHFLDPENGVDSNNGTTPFTPWRTFAKANGFAFQPGDDLWVLGGTTAQNQLVNVKLYGIGSNGNTTDQAIFGSYYVVGGVPYVNSPTNWTRSRRPSTYTYTVARPKILGTYHPACRQSNAPNSPVGKCAWNSTGYAQNPAWGIPGAVPENGYIALVTVTGKYLAMQDLDIEDSAGRGFYLYPDTSAWGYCFWNAACDTFAYIQRNKIGNMAEDAMTIFGSHSVIRQNEMFLTVLRVSDRPPGFNTAPGYESAGSAMGHAFCDPCYALDEGNDFWGNQESIGDYGTSFILVRGNWMGSDSRVGISNNRGASYVNEQNYLVGGTADEVDPVDRTANSAWQEGETFWPLGYEGDAGPGVPSSENGGYYRIMTGDQADSKTVRRNNIIESGIACGSQYLNTNAVANNYQVLIDTRDVGNTCISFGNDSFNFDAPYSLYANVSFYQAKNNLIVADATTCSQYQHGKVAFDYNQWTSLQTGPIENGDNCRGGHDIVSPTTGLPTSFNWSTASWLRFPTEADALPAATIAGNGRGLSMTGAMFTYNDSVWGHTDGSTGDTSFWGWVLRQRVWIPDCNSTGAQVPEAEWNKLLTTDYCGNPRSNPPSPGAREPTGYTPPPPNTALKQSGRWFAYNNTPLYLVGGDTQTLHCDTTWFDYTAMLDKFQTYRINKVRIFIDPQDMRSCPGAYSYNVGTQKFDLNTWSAAYWTTVHDFMDKALARGIMVEAEMFAEYPGCASIWGNAGAVDRPVRYNKGSNVNNAFSSNISGTFTPQWFQLQAYTEVSNTGLTVYDYQKLLVDKVLAELGGYANVFFHIHNEAYACGQNKSYVTPYQNYWAAYLNARTDRPIVADSEHDGGATALWVEMGPNGDISALDAHSLTTDPGEISVDTHPAHAYNHLIEQSEGGGYFDWYVRPGSWWTTPTAQWALDASGLSENTKQMWGEFVNGVNMTWYNLHQNVATWTTNVGPRIKALRDIIDTLPAGLTNMSPIDGGGAEYDTLVTNGPAGATNHQVLAAPGEAYIVLFWGTPEATNVSMTINPAGSYHYTFYDTRDGSSLGLGDIAAPGGSTTITAPAPGNWSGVDGLVLLVKHN